MGAGSSTLRLIRSQKSSFDELLKLRGETGGVIDTKAHTITHTHTAKGLDIKSMPEFPKSSSLVGWHTHPDSVEERLRQEGVLYPLGAIPSNIDIMTSLKTSLQYKEEVINVIISKRGICVYYPSTKMLDFLLSKPEKERKKIIKTIVAENLKTVYGEIFINTERNQIQKFIEEMKSLTREGEGYHIEFHSWR
jgi:hypothetical protein